MEWLIDQKASLWDIGRLRLQVHVDNAARSLREQFWKRLSDDFISVNGDVLWMHEGQRLIARYTGFYKQGHRGDLESTCLELWPDVRGAAAPAYYSGARASDRLEAVAHYFNQTFLPQAYAYRDQPDNVGHELARRFYVVLHLIGDYESDGDKACIGHVLDEEPELTDEFTL